MKPPSHQYLQHNQFETGAEVIELSAQGFGMVCEEQYRGMVNEFREFYATYYDHETMANIGERQMEIVLARHETGHIATKAILRATIPQSSQYAVSYKETNGFEVSVSDYSAERENTSSSYYSFSLGHRDSVDNERIYSRDSWTLERATKTKTWLNERLPLSRTMLDRLLQAAADPELNPQLSANARSKQQPILALECQAPSAANSR